MPFPRRHRQVDEHRLLSHGARERPQVDLQFVALGREDDVKAVGHHGIERAHVDHAGSEFRRVVFVGADAPEVRKVAAGHGLNQRFEPQRQLLEVLRAEQQPLVPLDQIGYDLGHR